MLEKIKLWASENPAMITYFLGAALLILIMYLIFRPAKTEKGHPKKQRASIGECNAEILQILQEYLEENPKTHFGQALLNLGIVETGEKNGKKYTVNPTTVSSHQMLTRIKYRNVERSLAEDDNY